MYLHFLSPLLSFSINILAAFTFLKVLYYTLSFHCICRHDLSICSACRVNGGVCNNNFVVQLMSDLTDQVINRSKQTEHMTSLGTAFFAGLAMGR